MKNILIFFIFLNLIFFVSPKRVFAISQSDVQNMISSSIAPLQSAITSLQNRVTALENSLLNILSRISSLEANVTADFTPPVSWNSNFNSTNRSMSLSTSRNLGTGCFWNGVMINGQQVQVRAVAHLSPNVFATGSCDLISFQNISNFPGNGTSFLVDLDLFWQGKLKHQQLSITVPTPTPIP